MPHSLPMKALRFLLVAFMTVAGLMHFVAPGFYAQIVPPPLPAMPVVYLSGVAEIALGVLLAFDRHRRLAAWGIVALLLAVFPANIYMAAANVQLTGLPAWMDQPSAASRWGRLPVQALFLAWAYLFTRREGQ
jgi:uncharacterized membrane protein